MTSSQLYMDGALSNNMPLSEQRNTITVAPFSGESDICPREGTFNVAEVHYGNVSIQVNTRNVHRICTSFLPPRLEVAPHIGYLYFKKWCNVSKYIYWNTALKYTTVHFCPWSMFRWQYCKSVTFSLDRCWPRSAITATWTLFVSWEKGVSSSTFILLMTDVNSSVSHHEQTKQSVPDLLGMQHAPCSLAGLNTAKPCCETQLNGPNPHQGDHWWLDLKDIENLPFSFKKGEADSWDCSHPSVLTTEGGESNESLHLLKANFFQSLT